MRAAAAQDRRELHPRANRGGRANSGWRDRLARDAAAARRPPRRPDGAGAALRGRERRGRAARLSRPALAGVQVRLQGLALHLRQVRGAHVRLQPRPVPHVLRVRLQGPARRGLRRLLVEEVQQSGFVPGDQANMRLLYRLVTCAHVAFSSFSLFWLSYFEKVVNYSRLLTEKDLKKFKFF